MTKPIIHLNGSGRAHLVNAYCEAAQALRAAIEAVHYAAPHGRDYYVIGPDAYADARQEHENRLHLLRAIKDELMDLSEHCANAGRVT